MEDSYSLSALRVLVIEDETLIGVLLEDMIGELGASFVGPLASKAVALEAADSDDFDVALVDLNLGGERADDVARLLAQRRIPFALVSGEPDMTLDLGQAAVLEKPFTFAAIETVLSRLSKAVERS